MDPMKGEFPNSSPQWRMVPDKPEMSQIHSHGTRYSVVTVTSWMELFIEREARPE